MYTYDQVILLLSPCRIIVIECWDFFILPITERLAGYEYSSVDLNLYRSWITVDLSLPSGQSSWLDEEK